MCECTCTHACAHEWIRLAESKPSAQSWPPSTLFPDVSSPFLSPPSSVRCTFYVTHTAELLFCGNFTEAAAPGWLYPSQGVGIISASSQRYNSCPENGSGVTPCVLNHGSVPASVVLVSALLLAIQSGLNDTKGRRSNQAETAKQAQWWKYSRYSWK